MKKKYFVDESLNEFGKRGRPRKIKDADIEVEDKWYKDDDEFDDEPEGPSAADIEEIELDDELEDIAIRKKISKMLDTELKMSEISRGILKFKVRSTGEKIEGIPLAKMSGGDAYLFKIKKGGMKKVRVDDMIVENYNGPQIFVSESFKDYE